MDYISFIKNVDKGLLNGTYLCCITEPYLWDATKKILADDVVGQNMLDFNYELIRFEDLTSKKFENAVETLPFMAEKRVVIIENIQLSKDSISKNEAVLQEIADYTLKPNPSTLLFMSFFGEKPFAGKMYKKMKPAIIEMNLFRLNRRELENFIQKFFSKKKLLLENGIVEAVIESAKYLEPDSEKTLFDIENTLQSIAGMELLGRIYLNDAKSVLYSEVESNVFRLLDAFRAKNVKECEILFQGFQKISMDSYELLYLLARQVRILIGMKAIVNKRIPDIDGAKRLKISPYEYKKTKPSVQNFSMQELIELHNKIYQIEKKAKTVQTNLNFELERFLACIKTQAMI